MSIQGLTVAILSYNDEGRIGRALTSARSVADRWLVIDTGSTDGTRAEVRMATQGWPGRLLRQPWVDAGTNRTDLVATAAEAGARWVLVLGAHEQLVDVEPLRVLLARTDADALQLPYSGSRRRWDTRLLRCGLPWAYDGTLRPRLTCGMGYRPARLEYPRLVDHAGADLPVGQRHQALTMLQSELAARPLNAQAWFDLGEAHRGLRQVHQALEAYQRCAATAAAGELRYLALLYAGCLLIGLRRDKNAVELLRQAVVERPGRPEALLQLCQFLNQRGRHRKVIELLRRLPDLRYTVPAKDALAIFAPAYSGKLLTAERVRAVNSLGGRAARLTGQQITGDPRLHPDAECGLASSALFDERRETDERREPPAAFLQRIQAAEWTCLDCVVSKQCGDYGHKHRLPGVFGGKLRTRADNQAELPVAAVAS